jgi:hypothetical protein
MAESKAAEIFTISDETRFLRGPNLDADSSDVKISDADLVVIGEPDMGFIQVVVEHGKSHETVYIVAK